MLRNLIEHCCNGFLLLAALTLYVQAGHASLEPASNHLNTPTLAQTSPSSPPLSNAAAKKRFNSADPSNIAIPKLSLSTHMSSVTLTEAPSVAPQQERDELLVAARAQPTQNHSDLGAAGAKGSAKDSDAAPNAETVMAAATVEKTYEQENNYLLALALILLTGSMIAYVLFSKRQ